MRITMLFIFTFLAGCSVYSAQPNFINGYYYMSGDDNCRSYQQIKTNVILCKNTNGQPTGYRQAMTQQQLEMYMHQQQMQMANQSMIQQQNIANQAATQQQNLILQQQIQRNWNSINNNMGCGWARSC